VPPDLARPQLHARAVRGRYIRENFAHGGMLVTAVIEPISADLGVNLKVVLPTAAALLLLSSAFMFLSHGGSDHKCARDNATR
jgi:hypothetical protein